MGVAQRPDFENWDRTELNVHAGWFGLTTDAESFNDCASLIAAIDACNDWGTV